MLHFRYGLVQIRDVSSVMFVVVDVHRLRINVRFERVVGVRQRRQCERPARCGRGGGGIGLGDCGGQRRKCGAGECGSFNGLASGHHNFIPFFLSNSARNVRSSASFSRWVCLVRQSSCGLANGIVTPLMVANSICLLASAYSIPQEHFIKSTTYSSPTRTTMNCSRSSGATSRIAPSGSLSMAVLIF